jgi:hypothetical protein
MKSRICELNFEREIPPAGVRFVAPRPNKTIGAQNSRVQRIIRISLC